MSFSFSIADMNATAIDDGGGGLFNLTSEETDLDCPEFDEDIMKMVDEISFWVEGVMQVKKS